MKLNLKHLGTDYLLFYGIITLLGLKLFFSYLGVEHSYWIRHLPSYFENYNFFGVNREFSSNIEFLLIPILLLHIVLNIKQIKSFWFTLVLSFVLIILNLITSFIHEIEILNSIQFSLKIISPILLFLSCLILNKKYNFDIKKTVSLLLKYTLVLVLIGLVFLEISMNRMKVQLPVYFSNIHTQSYILAICFIYFGLRWRKNKSTLWLLAYFIISFSFLFFGYGVRTASIFYLFYIAVSLYTRNTFFKYLWVQFIIYGTILLILLFLLIDFNWDQISSGRLTMYAKKLDIFGDYSLLEYLFGRGYGSDLITTERWSVGEKGSHNDFLTYASENGFVYVFFFIITILSLIPKKMKNNIIFLALIFGYFLTSLVSNGIAVRPLAGYLFFLVLSVLYIDVFLKKDCLFVKNEIK